MGKAGKIRANFRSRGQNVFSCEGGSRGENVDMNPNRCLSKTTSVEKTRLLSNKAVPLQNMFLSCWDSALQRILQGDTQIMPLKFLRLAKEALIRVPTRSKTYKKRLLPWHAPLGGEKNIPVLQRLAAPWMLIRSLVEKSDVKGERPRGVSSTGVGGVPSTPVEGRFLSQRGQESVGLCFPTRTYKQSKPLF